MISLTSLFFPSTSQTCLAAPPSAVAAAPPVELCFNSKHRSFITIFVGSPWSWLHQTNAAALAKRSASFFLHQKYSGCRWARRIGALRYHTLQVIWAMWRPNSMAFGLFSRPFCDFVSVDCWPGSLGWLVATKIQELGRQQYKRVYGRRFSSTYPL